MKIKSIEYANFRNFKDHGRIKCSTDGKVTIIYGKNGDGKTTLHQLFQWVIYGKTNFNKTTTEKLYNLQYEDNCKYNSIFEVMGQIDFEHAGYQYFMKRIYKYRKGVHESDKIAEEFTLQKLNENYDWKPVEEPEKFIEKLLPSGLAEYFFFDGESMIADLRVKGKDSATNLKKALYSMFDLDVLEEAVHHIGRTDLKTTVLGELFISKGLKDVNNTQIAESKNTIENFQRNVDKFKTLKHDEENKKSELDQFIISKSEEIGGRKSSKEYEIERADIKNNRELFLKNVKEAQFDFGETIMDMFPKILTAKAVLKAREKIQLKVEEEKEQFPIGVNKQLIEYLLRESTENCICGTQLGDKEREIIANYLNMMYPHSYTEAYSKFTNSAELYGKEYDREKLERCLLKVIDNINAAKKCDEDIIALDTEEKKNSEIEGLIIERADAERRKAEVEEKIQTYSTNLKAYTKSLKKEMDNYERLTEQLEGNKAVDEKIEIMKLVKENFEKKLDEAAEQYSLCLQKNIQTLIDSMLTSKRTVSVSKEFSVRVTDSFNDESKSEGQFAVVSFAYIGGILRMLKSEERLANKEYPLVLDGPFSKLDFEQRQNVVNMLPEFAPQVIIFSKDDLQDVFSDNIIGSVWTITSNSEKNLATVEEGHLWR